jgi:8-oxo-dGTP pyrophosphatase MutT (NUDIX family)
MKLLKTAIHPNATLEDASIFHRKAARAIILRNENILMLYTERYHDYTLPGGGVDESENIEQGLVRELEEETGATGIHNIKPFGIYEEFRPWYKPEFDVMHMESYCFSCEIDQELGQTRFEEHEVKNGMKPIWMNIHKAIEHNEETMKNSAKKGMSIERETFLLKLIVKELL